MEDLTELLNEWPYDEGSNVRIVVASDGRSVLQVRLPLGIEQYEMEGRPDRQRPREFDTVLEYMQDRLKRHIVEHGNDVGFEISDDDASELQAEGVLFYYRYLLLYQVQYYDMVIRDTEHNIALCNMLERYCRNEEARNAVLQFRPYILRMNAASRAMAVGQGTINGDRRRILSEAIERIEELEEIDSPAFQFERVRSINYLRSIMRSFDGDDDRSLEDELHEAMEAEEYERAARIRDRLRSQDDIDRVDKER